MKLFKPLLLVSFALLSTLGFYITLSYFESRKPDPSPIQFIVQTGPLKEALKTDYLAELLDLSVDVPTSCTPEKAEKILLKSPLIKTASVSLLNPKTLYIDYTLRAPRFILGDVENLAIDEEGISFPFSPYFTPKRLPTLYLGDSIEQKWPLVIHLAQLLGEEVSTIDVAHCLDRSQGKRGIVVTLEGEGWTHLLRLTPKSYEEELAHYRTLRKKMNKGEMIIDLRVPNLAYITPRDH